MSYILDALRKSDQQRQRGTTPTLLTTQAAAAESRRPAYLLYGLLAAALLGVGVAIGWLQAWQQAPVTPVAAPVAVKSPEPARLLVPQPLPEVSVKVEPALPLQTSPPTEPAATVPIAQKDVETPRQAVAAAVPTPAPEQAVKVAPAEPIQEPTVVTMAELPSSIQQEIPVMQVSLHAYSAKPKASLVSINNQLLRDGDTLASGLKLEQITPDGMIFSYKGYRFRRGVK